MSRNRYGRIYHSDHSYINLRFKSLDARRAFEAKFNRYHAEHDHDGEPPRFQEATAAEIGNPDTNTIHDVDSVTIDGYATYEIEEYHEDDGLTRHHRYEPPTCCVAPIISIKRKFVQSDSLTRHELSAVFGDMPDEDYQHLLDSVKEEGFIDPIIRLLGNEVLDGWHRYRAGKELNLLRKLIFRQWDTEKEGNPAGFAFARNIERRHLTPGQRAQIVVTFNERFGMGRPKSEKSPSNDGLKSGEDTPPDEPKTREQLAKQAGVGVATIDRAVAVEKQGKSEAVISGEQTAGEVLKQRDLAKAVKRKKQVLKNIWDTRQQVTQDYLGEADTDLNQFLTLPDLEKGFARENNYCGDIFQTALKRIEAARGNFADFQETALGVDENGLAVTDTQDLEAEYKAILTYAGDIRQWDREDWSPDTNWILPLIEEAKAKKKSPKPKTTDKAQELAEDQQRAKQAEQEMWDALESVAPDWARDDFAAAACDRMDFGVTEFPDPLETDQPAIWRPRFELLRKEIELPADWIQQLLKKMAETDEPEPEPEETVKSASAPHSVTESGDTRELWEQVSVQIPKWKQWYKESGYKESDLVSRASKSQLINALRVLRKTEQGGAATVEELKELLGLLKNKSYPLAFRLLPIIRPDQPEPAEPAEPDADTDEPDEDTSLAEIDNLPAVKHFLESLLKQVETDIHIHQTDKDNFSCMIYDMFLSDGDVYITERQQLAILIDVAYTLVSESL